jgi:predicted ATPase
MSTPVPCCGRDGELAALSEQLDRVRAGDGTVVLIEGAAGMGKTRLLDEVLARRPGFRIGSSAADPGHSMVELATLMAALSDGPDPILDRAELPDSRTLPEQRYWVLRDLQVLLGRAARERPVLICVDDLQWADSGTAAALRALPGRLAAVPVAWVLAFRPSPASRQVKSALDYLEHSGARTMVLDPLTGPAVRESARSEIRRVSGVSCNWTRSATARAISGADRHGSRRVRGRRHPFHTIACRRPGQIRTATHEYA